MRFRRAFSRTTCVTWRVTTGWSAWPSYSVTWRAASRLRWWSAVTFDDGYRDNYECAFPILQRYRIPATIFLTTGVIDSGEPLWFEQLAEAIKKTPHEYIDLEIDIPRRFWMRSPAERLESNRKIFALLRAFSDTERRTWVAELLGKLGAAGEWARTRKNADLGPGAADEERRESISAVTR